MQAIMRQKPVIAFMKDWSDLSNSLQLSFHHFFLVNDSPWTESHYFSDTPCIADSEVSKLTFSRHSNKEGTAFFFNCRLLTYPGRKQLFSKWSEQSKWCDEGLKSGWQRAWTHCLQSFGSLRGNLWMNELNLYNKLSTIQKPSVHWHTNHFTAHMIHGFIRV
jgi:hypothetical protein